MKTIVLIFTLIATFAQAQWLSTPTVLPQSPTPADSVQIIIETFTPNQGHKLGRSFSVQKTGLIVINICNYDGMATAIEQYVDTFQVGQLPAGNYSLQVNYSTSWDTQLCLPKSDTTAGHQFTVQTVTGVSDEYGEELIVYPNPADDWLHVRMPVAGRVELLNLQGQSVQRLDGSGEKKVHVGNLPKGIYLLKAYHRNRTSFSKIIVR